MTQRAPLRVVGLISGTGTNLRALLDALAGGEIPANIVAIGADRDATGLALAEEYSTSIAPISTFIVHYQDFPDRTSWGNELITAVSEHEPDLVVLSGFMRLVPPAVVETFAPNIVNTHPAYLPEFPGAHAVRDTLAAGASQSGASIIIVNNSIDGGPLIARERVTVQPDDTEETLHERIKVVERRLLIETVRGVAASTLILANLKDTP